MPTPTEPRVPVAEPCRGGSLCRHPSVETTIDLGGPVDHALTGCGEASRRSASSENRRELEALLTASSSLKNTKELERDAKRIDDRRASGELSDASYKELEEIVKKARAGDWSGAEKQAYELRESKPFFK